MTPNKTSRGRPRGTGLNDAAQLRAIAGLMTSHPDLKPTTAIRQLGIQDPSVIRRLRDKYNACEAQLIAELRSGAPNSPALTATLPAATAAKIEPRAHQEPGSPPPAAVQPAAYAAKNGSRVVALSAANGSRKSRPVPAQNSTPAAPATIDHLPVKRRTDAIRPPSETELPNWMGVGLSLYVLSMEAQFAVIGTLFEWPPLAAAVRSHVTFTEIAVAMTRPVLSGPTI